MSINLSTLEQEISDATGFDQGDKFSSEKEVRAYFTPKTQRGMFGDQAVKDKNVLRNYAEAVIDNRWHCKF